MRAVALRCPFCLNGFIATDELTQCIRCHAFHHTACWEANHHCSVFACQGPGHACRSRTFPRLMETLPPIFLLLLFLLPQQLIAFVPLLIPAELCSVLIAAHLLGEIFHGRAQEWDVLTIFERGFCFASNLMAIFLGILTLTGLFVSR